jgi:hypothetical protein
MGLHSTFEINGLRDALLRIARLGLQAKDLRRPNGFIGAEMVKRNRARLDRSVDVNGRPMTSSLSKKLGLAPLGGGHGLFGKSIKWSLSGSDLELFSTFIGAGVAYRGDTIVPRVKKWLTIPLEARGGSESRGRAGLTFPEGRSVTGRRALHYENTFFLRVNGKLFLVQKDKRTKGKHAGSLRFLFLLVKRVKYPKNEWLGFSNADLEMAAKTYGEHMDTFKDNPK